MNHLLHREYIGDSVYVGYDGYHAWLYTDNGFGPTNQIALEPSVADAFIKWLTIIRENYGREKDIT